MALALSLWLATAGAADSGNAGAVTSRPASAPAVVHLTVPASAAASVPAAGQEPSSEALPIPEYKEPSLLPVPTAGSLEEALAFTPVERDILFAVRDGDGQLDTAALYVLLRRAMMLPSTAQALAEADPIHATNLWKDPVRYRGQLIRVEANYAGKSIDWSQEVTPSVWWGTREVYAVYAYIPGTSEPLLVFLTQKPPEPVPAKLEIVGFFYKLLGERSSVDPAKRGLYPVIVAKDVQRQAFSGPAMSPMLGIIMGVAAVLLIVWMAMRRRNRRLNADIRRRQGRRGQADDEAAEGPDGVDEELQRQVEQFQATHQEKGDER